MQGQHKLEVCGRAAQTKQASLWNLTIKVKVQLLPWQSTQSR
jgi:hypothetical protein